jgi:transposase-like protein
VATRRNFTQEYKDQAVSLVLDSGRSIAEVAKSIGIHEMTLGALLPFLWVRFGGAAQGAGPLLPGQGRLRRRCREGAARPP